MAVGVEIVIVTFRPPEGDLVRAVRSVVADRGARGPMPSDPVTVRVEVIDNGGDAARALAGSGVDVDGLVHVTNAHNDGFGAAANIGIAAALRRGADVIVVLNDDVEVEPGWLEPILAEFDDVGVGAVQPLLATIAGDAVASAGVHIDHEGSGTDVGRGEPIESFDLRVRDVDVFTGGAVAFARAFLLDVGTFDERFFLYYEDVELARRGSRRGWRYRLVPRSRVRHRGSATTDRMGDRVVMLRERNRMWSAAMHGSFGEVRAATWLSIRRVRHRPRRAHASGLARGVVGAATRILQRIARSIRNR